MTWDCICYKVIVGCGILL